MGAMQLQAQAEAALAAMRAAGFEHAQAVASHSVQTELNAQDNQPSLLRSVESATLSLAGIVTFPRATELHEVARMVPLERLLIETDSPFLAPVPHRGTRNEPARVVLVAEAIAALRQTTCDVVATATQKNFERLFQP